ncbi:MAG TPA: preprotein translocase subunit SecA [Candidatus Polarisedimenticolia bacterium]|jgi:preprotein translocase subunit SecA|nr:preprotein translocase subunit SecA [Candidatus Polarisedimenticolia bacterium]
MFLDAVLRQIIGSKNERELRKLTPRVQAINALEPGLQNLSDAELAGKTVEFRRRLEAGAALDDLLHEAFAVVREAGRRALGMRHFDVQLIGGMVLHHGKIAEMKTGEGKTLVATLPVYLNSLPGRGVHVVTVNDYLARRDAEWMGRLYRFLGLSVGVIQHDLDDAQRQEAYAADVTYGTNNEFGFDYLRDNMKYSLDAFVQRGHVFAIVDEVDSILIDEARTPLIISGPSDESVNKYYEVDRIIPRLAREEDFKVDEKARTVSLTEGGVEKVEKLLGVPNLYDPEAMEVNHCVQQALKAHVLFKRDVDYMVKEGQVVIVDEFTGRLMPGRRWSDGLHQAVEAKEKVKIEKENQTLATITFQNYFRMYEKLAGMTGTADTEAVEFDKIYKLEVMVVPTNRPLIRAENPDVVYRTEEEKARAVIEEIVELHEKGQPVLVGTVSIERSEHLSGFLKKKGVPHVVLNAKYHEREAEIVAQAGRLGAVTIATNMAGRGTDILLGGNPEYLARKAVATATFETPPAAEAAYSGALAEARSRCAEEHDKVVALGGLHILGTERHEARRIDNQLRGRAGRQGDPGSSRFYLSLEDDLLRIFGSDRLKGIMQKLGMEEDVPIVHGMVTRSIERAQKQVEARNFDIRKHLLEYDDVMNKQRVEIYRLRRELLEGKGQGEYLIQKMEEILDWILETHAPEEAEPEDWSVPEISTQMLRLFGIDPVREGVDFGKVSRPELRERLGKLVQDRYAAKEAALGPEIMRQHERLVMLNVIDTQWKDHLLTMDHLKEGIGLRGYGQRDPLTEYKRESFEMFSAMKERIEDDIVRFLFLMDPVVKREEDQMRRRQERDLVFTAPAKEAPEPARRAVGKVGRNDPCPCGSGKKYKKCHGAAVEEGKVVHGARS